MQRLHTSVFYVLIFGGLGVYVGYVSRSQEISILKEWISSISALGEKPVLVFQFDAKPLTVDDEDLSYMKQIAHVQAPQDSLIRVSKPFVCASTDVSTLSEQRDKRLDDLYKKHIEHTCSVLRAVNHSQELVRLFARLQLAQVRVVGPLGQYMQELATALLVRFCDDDGRLVHTHMDMSVQDDICKALALLQEELVNERGWGQIARADFAPIQRRVQRQAYNGVLRKKLSQSSSTVI